MLEASWWIHLIVALGLFGLLSGLLYAGRGYWAWMLSAAGALFWWALNGGAQVPSAFGIVLGAVALAAVIFGVPSIRQVAVTRQVLPILKAMLPSLSPTEQQALEAGDVWWDGELFSGAPDWQKLVDFKRSDLSEKEQQFLDGPCEELCKMLDDWEIAQERDLDKETWEFLKKNKFFGMIIPEEYGGLGFSATAHSAVVVKVGSRSITGAVTVMVPNSLGPGELLLHYGTDKQKKHYLPRLADGREIPCFGLTEPEAGSDAGSAKSYGVVMKGEYKGEECLGMKLNWEKRYITLGPVATVIGLAFRLYDPDGLLGDTEDLGITCALIPADLHGIDIGQRHDPCNVPFQNGPNWGKDVFVPLDFIIGGPKMAGKGWMMLMQSLSAGRSISIPSLSTAAAEVTTRVTGAYATVREQFGIPIGEFEGVKEPLARIGANTYTMNSVRKLTVSAVDAGYKPAVLSAVAKAYVSEGMRSVVNDGMDILGGAAICRGPHNVLERAYSALPISITVEGANILTRSMIIYGQGAIRAHPYVIDEIRAANDGDVAKLDGAFFGHVGHVFQNTVRTLLCGLTGARVVTDIPFDGKERRYAQRLTQLSSGFALMSEAAMVTMGGKLKFAEHITGRFADVLAEMYLATAVLKEFIDSGMAEKNRPAAHWAIEHSLFKAQEAMLGILDNFPARPVAWALKALIFPFGRVHKRPSDKLTDQLADSLLYEGEVRNYLSENIFVPSRDECGLGRLQEAVEYTVGVWPLRRRIHDAVKSGTLDKKPESTLYDRALDKAVIDQQERSRLSKAQELMREVIEVDAWDQERFKELS